MVLQEIEGFSYATALDLNMGYITPLDWIQMHPQSVPLYFLGASTPKKRLPMGIAGSPDIFKGKMSELMESLEYVRAYLDDLLRISKLSLEDHLEKLEVVLGQLRDAGL